MAVLSPPVKPEQSSSPEPTFQHTSKRRRLARGRERQNDSFVPASSLTVFSLDDCHEAPRPTPSSSSFFSSSSSSYLTAAPDSAEKEVVFTVAGSSVETSPVSHGGRTKQRTKAAAAMASHSMSHQPSTNSPFFLTTEEREWLNTEQALTSAGKQIIDRRWSF